MDFGDAPDNTVGVDPVSGNEIPLGSSAEEVRDDIPANLSEGEIVMAADVVKFFGIKFFEDLRKAAKIGYAKMAEDGRIGGQPMPMEDTSGLGLEITDLEIMEVEDEPEDAFLGKFFARLREASREAQKEDNKPRDRSTSAIKKRVASRKNKPKNRYEEMREMMREIFRDDDKKPSRPSTKKQPKKPSKLDLGFGGNPIERGARKYGGAVPEQNDAGYVTDAYTGENLRSDESFYQRFMQGLGYDEGGMASPFEQEGGFDLETISGGSVVEVRKYQNDAGHVLYITFIDGEPTTDIPDGYYPVGDDVSVETSPSTEQAPSSSSGGGGGFSAPTPTPIDYKNLSVDELADLVKESQSMKGNIIAGGMGLINPILGGAVKFAMYSQAKQTIAELERRLQEPNLAIYEKEYLENLLEIAKRDKPNLIQRLFGTKEEAAKQGVELEEMEGIEMTGTGELPEVTVTELPGLDGKPYSPDVKADEAMSTQEIEDMANKAIETSTQPYVSQPFTPLDNEPNAPYGGAMETILNDGRSSIGSAATSSKRTSSVPQASRDAASKALVGYDDRTKNKIDDARRNLATDQEIKAIQDAADRTKQTLKNLERGIVTGFDEGGLVNKPKVEKVVKGLKKASKSHAKQADQLEKALKASKKKKKSK